jgi:hypothetical protein
VQRDLQPPVRLAPSKTLLEAPQLGLTEDQRGIEVPSDAVACFHHCAATVFPALPTPEGSVTRCQKNAMQES